MAQDWLVGGVRADSARNRLLDVAATIVAQRGIDRFEINDLAARAHCSRATVYRHVGGKQAIVETVLGVASVHIVDTVREAVVSLHGPERAQVAIEVALREIRADPVTSQFIRSGRFLEGTSLVLHSPVVARIAAELIDLDPTDNVPAALAVRSVLALLIWPASTPELEIQMIEELAVAVCRH